MQNASAFFGIAIVVSGAALAGLACGEDRGGFREEMPPPPLSSEDSGTIAECKPTVSCSRDLKQVLHHNCGGTEEVETCGPAQGCGDGRCLADCTSA